MHTDQKILDTYYASGQSASEAARQLGRDRRTVKRAVDRAQANGMKPSPEVADTPLNPHAVCGRGESLSEKQRDQASLFGIPEGQLRGGWVKDEGASYYFQVPKPEEDPNALTDAIVGAMRDVPKPETLPAPEQIEPNAAVFPIADLHLGLLTDGEEVSENWDTKIAGRAFRKTFTEIMNLTPGSEVAVIVNLGDLMHMDDVTNMTPQSKHVLDADSRYFKVLRAAVQCMTFAIDTALMRHGRVIYRGQRGNHDMNAHYAVTLALAERYRDHPRVEVIESANEFFAWQFGKTMLLTAHGDKTTPERLTMMAAADYPSMWATTNYRLALTGHIHHVTRKECHGMTVESIGTIIPRDAYAHSHGYGAGRALTAILLSQNAGEIARFRVPVEVAE